MRAVVAIIMVAMLLMVSLPQVHGNHNVISNHKTVGDDATGRIKIDGKFRDWNLEDVRAVDNYGDEYRFNDGYDDSRDIIAFYYRYESSTLFFRVDFLNLQYAAEVGNMDLYIAINYSSGGQNWLPDYVETQTNTPWEICLAIYDTSHYAVYLSNWSYGNWSIEGIKYNSQVDAVELALNSSILQQNGWDGSPLTFQVYTTRDGTNGGPGEISSGTSNTPESDIVDAIGSSIYRGNSNSTGWLNGSISSSSSITPTKIAFLHHANQFLKNISYFVGDKNVGMYAVPSIHEYWHVPVNLHISGTLADGIEYYRPDFNRYLRKLADEGIAHMVGGFYAEYIPKYLPREFNNWSMEEAKEYNERYYNYTPQVCWIPERVYWHGWERTVKDGGYKIVVADTEVAFNWYHPSWASEGRDEYYVWNDSGVKVLFISNTGRAGNWQNIQDMLPNPTDGGLNENIRKLLVRNEIEDAANRYILYMDDWEKFFGNAPGWGGPEVVKNYNESIGWIAQHPWIHVASLEELANLPVHGNITIGDASYFWLTQNLGTAGSDSAGPNDSYDLYDAWYYDPYHEITVGVPYFNYTPVDNLEKLGDFRTPHTVIHDVWKNISKIPESSPIYDVAMKSFAAMMYETAWRGKGISITMHDDISDWEKDQASHIKDVNIFHFAQKWLDNPQAGIWREDVNMDGFKDIVFSNGTLFGVVSPRGGKITFLMDSQGRILIGNPVVGWHEQGSDFTDIVGIATSNYHYEDNPVPYNLGSKSYAFEEIGYENSLYNLSMDGSRIIANIGNITKTYSITAKGIIVNYSTPDTIGVRITASPNFQNLTSLEFVANKSVRGIKNGLDGLCAWVAATNASFYLEKRETMSGYMVYYGDGKFSFVLQFSSKGYTNLPPWQIKQLPVLRVPEDGKRVNMINLSEFFRDDISQNLKFILKYNDSSGVYVTMNGTWVSVDANTGEKNNNWNGWINVTVIAMDGEGAKTDAILRVYIYPVDDPPSISISIKNNATISRDCTITISAKDIDSPSVSTWYSIDGGNLVEGNKVKLDVHKLGDGKHTLMVKASDGNLSTYENITFFVETPKYYTIPAIASSLITFVALVSAWVYKKKKRLASSPQEHGSNKNKENGQN